MQRLGRASVPYFKPMNSEKDVPLHKPLSPLCSGTVNDDLSAIGTFEEERSNTKELRCEPWAHFIACLTQS